MRSLGAPIIWMFHAFLDNRSLEDAVIFGGAAGGPPPLNHVRRVAAR